MVISLFALFLFFSDVGLVASPLRSYGSVTADIVTSARASSDALNNDSVYRVCTSAPVS